MGLSVFGWCVLAVLVGAPACAIASAVVAKRLFWEDLGILVLPAALFFVAAMFRHELQIGFAMLLWPIIIGAVSMYVFAGKTALAHRVADARSVTRLVALASTLVAFLLAVFVPPWYE